MSNSPVPFWAFFEFHIASNPDAATESKPEPPTESKPEPPTESKPEPPTESKPEPPTESKPEPPTESKPEPITPEIILCEALAAEVKVDDAATKVDDLNSAVSVAAATRHRTHIARINSPGGGLYRPFWSELHGNWHRTLLNPRDNAFVTADNDAARIHIRLKAERTAARKVLANAKKVYRASRKAVKLGVPSIHKNGTKKAKKA
jgi:hypothetical protein